MATREDLERRRDLAKAAAGAVREPLPDMGDAMGQAFADGLRSGIRTEPEYRLLTDAEAMAKIRGDAEVTPALAAIEAEQREAMAAIDRNFAENARTA